MAKIFKCLNCDPENPCYLSSAGDSPHKCPHDIKQHALWLKAPAFDFTVAPKRKPVIYAIDFDGTIVENRFPAIGHIIPEAENFIRALRQRGDKWILYTMREGDYLLDALEYLAINDLAPDAANENLPEMCATYRNNPRKVFANVYIDDHNAGGVRFEEARDNQREQR